VEKKKKVTGLTKAHNHIEDSAHKCPKGKTEARRLSGKGGNKKEPQMLSNAEIRKRAPRTLTSTGTLNRHNSN